MTSREDGILFVCWSQDALRWHRLQFGDRLLNLCISKDLPVDWLSVCRLLLYLCSSDLQFLIVVQYPIGGVPESLVVLC